MPWPPYPELESGRGFKQQSCTLRRLGPPAGRRRVVERCSARRAGENAGCCYLDASRSLNRESKASRWWPWSIAALRHDVGKAGDRGVRRSPSALPTPRPPRRRTHARASPGPWPRPNGPHSLRDDPLSLEAGRTYPDWPYPTARTQFVTDLAACLPLLLVTWRMAWQARSRHASTTLHVRRNYVTLAHGRIDYGELRC